MFNKTLEGLEAATIPFAKIDLGDRFDAEYFYKNSLDIEHKLLQRKSLPFHKYGDFVASAFYPGATELYQFGSVPFMRCVDCIPYPFITNNQENLFEKLPQYFVSEQKGINTLSKGDIVITKVGSPCFASIIEEYDYVALSRTVLGVKNIRGVDPYYLLVFLRSKYGFGQLQRQRELTIQYQLTLDRVKNILIFLPDESFQKAIKMLASAYNEQAHKAVRTYRKAEEVLLDQVDLKNWEPPKESKTIKSFKESFLLSGRLDAEYYQPKYYEIVKHAKKQPFDILGNLVTIKKSIEPGSDAYGFEGIPFIRVADLSKFGLSEPEIFLDKNDFDLEGLKPRKDRILLSKDGSVGIAYKLEEDIDAITSGAILHLTIVDSRIDPDYLCLVLNSMLVQLQAERDAGGSIIQHWKPDEIKQVVIPILPENVQHRIKSLVQESFQLQQESKRLFDAAKYAIELAIEEGEEVALQWLHNQKNYQLNFS